MLLPDHYGYGNLFAFSGLDGENSHSEDFAGMIMDKKLTVRFDGENPVTLFADTGDIEFKAVLSDVMIGENIRIVFADKNTVAGIFDGEVTIFCETAPCESEGDNILIGTDGFYYSLSRRGGRFALCREKSREKAFTLSEEKLGIDIESLCEKRISYYRSLPECKRPEYEKLYYKCLEVNKLNVYSPQDGIDCRFTTPDRLPHRHMWLWDSMFHAVAISGYDISLAKDAIRAVLQCQRDDGFIPHMIKSRADISSITQPQVIAWAVLKVYDRDKDKSFLAECAYKIEKYLLWFIENRDKNRNGLFEWKTDFANTRCRCDESGMDNSPRFDTVETLDAIDCSCFMVNDCRCLSEIFSIIGESERSQKFKNIADKTAGLINECLWDENTGAYCDRTFSGELTGVLTCSSFLPLFAGVCDKSRVERLLSLLCDESKFATAFPVPSIARCNPLYGADMWRGGTWLNYNYFIASGLRRYGFESHARGLVEKTLECVGKWYDVTGNIFEFYDAEDKIAPWFLNRKGTQPEKPDYRIRYHSITDYNWSACFILLMLAGEF